MFRVGELVEEQWRSVVTAVKEQSSSIPRRALETFGLASGWFRGLA